MTTSNHLKSQQSTALGLVIFSSIILAIMVILCIINYSISQTLNWSLYPIGALFMVWATSAPAIGLPKYKLVGSYIGLSFTLVPFLYMVANLTGEGEWFAPLALPLALSLLVTIGIFFVFSSRLNNIWYIIAIAFFLFGVVINYAVNLVLRNNHIEQDMRGKMINSSTIYSFLLATCIFTLIGYQRRIKS